MVNDFKVRINGFSISYTRDSDTDFIADFERFEIFTNCELDSYGIHKSGGQLVFMGERATSILTDIFNARSESSERLPDTDAASVRFLR